jgi:hypothetical protein
VALPEKFDWMFELDAWLIGINLVTLFAGFGHEQLELNGYTAAKPSN